MSTLEKFCPWRVQCICINFAVMVVKSKANALQKAIKNRSRRGDHSSFYPLIVPFPSTVIVQLTSSCTLLLKFYQGSGLCLWGFWSEIGARVSAQLRFFKLWSHYVIYSELDIFLWRVDIHIYKISDIRYHVVFMLCECWRRYSLSIVLCLRIMLILSSSALLWIIMSMVWVVVIHAYIQHIYTIGWFLHIQMIFYTPHISHSSFRLI